LEGGEQEEMLTADDDAMQERLDALAIAIDVRCIEFDRGTYFTMVRKTAHEGA
jgi:hypothetical protein